MRTFIKNSLMDTKFEPYARWLVKRYRGIRMPFDLVKNEIYDRQASDVMRRVLSPDSNCIDIGCHQGQFLKAFLEYAPRGKHYAFEPIPHLAAQLHDRFPQVQVFPYALSDSKGDATFYLIPESPALSGLNARDFLAAEKTRQAIPVHVERLDDMIPPDVKIQLIKIDVEGAEGPVIAGGLDTIKRNHPHIVMEHGSESSEAFGFPSERVYDLLVDLCGLKVSHLDQWLHGGRPLTRVEFIQSKEWYFIAHPHP